ncbi:MULTISPECIES: FecR family protein [Sphingobium]|jgi:transmembrane sensor|uniref:FecR family protein n=1 Tax=Sphingobium TaxID=165695 RepID=UPI0010F8972F|nr:FecR domain-containing protein [Sphingobium sp. RSMS]UXC92973.1 FecR domain-containing protein [Sphingobium sp. RSMS]
MNKLSWWDRRAASKWVMKMLYDPDRHHAAVQRWMAAKEGRQRLYETMLVDVGAAAGAAAVAPMPVERRAVPAPKWRPALAAVAVMTVISGALIMMQFHAPVSPEDAFGGGQLATRIGEVREVRLDDGSVLTLDTGTTINVDLSAEQRVVSLERGRARFRIVHDAARPFIVRFGQNEISSPGTIFDVSYGNRAAVHLLEGRADVKVRGWRSNARAEQLFHLRSGEQLSFLDGQAMPPSVMSARPTDEQWVSGVKNVDDVPISEVIVEANSYSTTQIVLADPTLGSREIFGSVHIRDVDAVANAIAAFLEAKVDRSHPGKLIITK